MDFHRLIFVLSILALLHTFNGILAETYTISRLQGKIKISIKSYEKPTFKLECDKTDSIKEYCGIITNISLNRQPLLQEISNDAFVSTPNLEVLHLKHNPRLTTLQQKCFNSLTKLTLLNISDSGIQAMPPTEHIAATLLYLDISHTAIETLNLCQLTKLLVLKMDNISSLTSINSTCFLRLNKLNTLSMKKLQFSRDLIEVILSLPNSIEKLNIGHTLVAPNITHNGNLTNIQQLSATACELGNQDTNNILEHLTNLSLVVLRNNHIGSQFPNFTTVAHSIATIDLSQNDIRQILQNDVVGLQNLKYLDISKNLITSISEEVSQLSSLETLYFRASSKQNKYLICDCNLAWIKNSSLRIDILSNDTACPKPERFSHLPWGNITYEMMITSIDQCNKTALGGQPLNGAAIETINSTFVTRTMQSLEFPQSKTNQPIRTMDDPVTRAIRSMDNTVTTAIRTMNNLATTAISSFDNPTATTNHPLTNPTSETNTLNNVTISNGQSFTTSTDTTKANNTADFTMTTDHQRNNKISSCNGFSIDAVAEVICNQSNDCACDITLPIATICSCMKANIFTQCAYNLSTKPYCQDAILFTHCCSKHETPVFEEVNTHIIRIKHRKLVNKAKANQVSPIVMQKLKMYFQTPVEAPGATYIGVWHIAFVTAEAVLFLLMDVSQLHRYTKYWRKNPVRTKTSKKKHHKLAQKERKK